MITPEHRVSELISMYKNLALMYNTKAGGNASLISQYVTEQNLLKSTSSLNIQRVLTLGDEDNIISTLLHKEGKVVIRDEMKNLSFEKNEFDLVIAENAYISLLDDPISMITELRRILKPGGYLWIDYLNLLGWAMLQPDAETRMQLVSREEELIYMGKDEYPLRFFTPKKIRHMMYDAGFMEVNEFGNGILVNPLSTPQYINGTEIKKLQETELEMSRNFNLSSSAFHIQVLAQKIIY